MPLNLTKLANNRASLAVDLGGGNVLNVDYYPERITSRMLLDTAAAAEAAGSDPTAQAAANLNANAKLLLAVLASWDAVVEDDSGNEIAWPITLDNLLALSLAASGAIVKAISADASGTNAGKS